MEVLYPRCCGLDVHKKTVVACVRIAGASGRPRQTVRTFGTMTADLLALAAWLATEGVTHVAMESTGVFWKPIWNLLEGQVSLLLVNARHIKQVPGRKTDVKDCEWLAQLLAHGLVRGSFVPPPPIRELRDLTRHRATLLSDKARVANRIHKTLEDANVKLGAVATDILGVSGRAMLRALVAGASDPAALAELARKRLREKLPALRQALDGRVTAHHRFLLDTLLDNVAFLEAQVARLDARIAEQLQPFTAELALLRTVPGVGERTAQNALAELGPDMTVFPSEGHLASWAGLCPGSHESAGKQKSGRTPKGNRWLRRTLTEAAWAASRKKGSYFKAQYHRLVPRRGKKRAIVAVAHSLLGAMYHILAKRVPYQDLGPDHFDRLAPKHLTRYLVKRLEKLGHKVTLEPLREAA